MQECMYKIEDLLMKDLAATSIKPQLTPQDYEMLDKAVDILKDLKTIEAMENYQETDYEVSANAMPRHDMSSRRGRSAYTGRYISRDNGFMPEDMMSYARTPEEHQMVDRMLHEMGR